MKKKIILNLLYVAFLIFLLVGLFPNFYYNFKLVLMEKNFDTTISIDILRTTILLCLMIVLLICLIVFRIIYLIKITNADYFIKYTYEEYKTIMDKKKTEKQEKKKQKLQQQLNSLNKTE